MLSVDHLIELGHYAAILAFVLALVQAVAPLAGAWARRPAWGGIAVRAALAQPLLIGIGAAALVRAFLADDFSVVNVAQNSNSALPWGYKVAATWGSHEGSLYLWALILAGYTGLLAVQARRRFPDRAPAVLAVQGALLVGFLGLILFLSSPFERVWPPPGDGRDLNPLLQDPGMAIHPPMLYLGYVGFSVPYALVMGALITRWPAAQWLGYVRRWTLIAWAFLTTGIVLGGWWAYYELGWGGYWAWDPVENASFMPWLTATALLHSLMVQAYRRMLGTWNLFLVLATFSLSLIGTFLVRSGVLTSVHAFAVDPGRGVYILAFLVVVLVGSFGLFLVRAGQGSGTPRPTALFSREGLLLGNNVLLGVAAGAVLLGTLYPLALDVTAGERITVAAPYFNAVIVPMLLLLVVLMGITPSLPWRRADPRAALRRYAPGLAAAAAGLGLAAWLRPGSWQAWLGFSGAALAGALVLAELARMVGRIRRAAAAGTDMPAWLDAERRRLGALVTHLGVVIVAAGMIGSGLFRHTATVTMQPGDVLELAGHRLSMAAVATTTGPNYDAERARFEVNDGAYALAPERRVYHATRMPTTEAAIHSTVWRDVYVVFGEARDGRYPVTAYVNPLVQWIWAGAAVMVLGALLARGRASRVERS